MTVARRDDELLGGALVFAGTRVPVSALFDYLERSSLRKFLADFPSVTRAQALSVLENARAAFSAVNNASSA